MHFHLPKPLHGWREFAGEVGIIVIGVLIALGAEQVMETWQWHEKVSVVRNSLAGELGNDRARWEVDVARMRCLKRDIDQLDRWAQGEEIGDVRRVVQDLVNSNLFWMHSANWNLATSSNTLDHFPMAEQLAFAALYDGIAHDQVYLEKASDLIERVPAQTAVAVDPRARGELRDTLGELSMKVGSLAGNDAYMTRHFDAVGVKANRSDFAADLGASKCG